MITETRGQKTELGALSSTLSYSGGLLKPAKLYHHRVFQGKETSILTTTKKKQKHPAKEKLP